MSEKPEVRAYEWWCGDEVCDCTQYRIERVLPRWTAYGTRYDRELVWEGQFMSISSEETRAEKAERLWAFRKAAHENGITLTRTQFGHWAGERPEAVA